MRILVDMDGVIANWGATWDDALDSYGEHAADIPRHADQTSFNLNEGRTDDEKEIIAEIFESPGFYRHIAPIDGARTALKGLLRAGHDVRIVTSPWVSNPTCASDKLNWVIEHYGSRWAQRVIITTDKTLVRGDILIDDKPVISGELPEYSTGANHARSWEHVIFDQPYNRHITNRRRILDWGDIRAIAEILE